MVLSQFEPCGKKRSRWGVIGNTEFIQTMISNPLSEPFWTNLSFAQCSLKSWKPQLNVMPTWETVPSINIRNLFSGPFFFVRIPRTACTEHFQMQVGVNTVENYVSCKREENPQNMGLTSTNPIYTVHYSSACKSSLMVMARNLFASSRDRCKLQQFLWHL